MPVAIIYKVRGNGRMLNEGHTIVESSPPIAGDRIAWQDGDASDNGIYEVTCVTWFPRTTRRTDQTRVEVEVVWLKPLNA